MVVGLAVVAMVVVGVVAGVAVVAVVAVAVAVVLAVPVAVAVLDESRPAPCAARTRSPFKVMVLIATQLPE